MKIATILILILFTTSNTFTTPLKRVFKKCSKDVERKMDFKGVWAALNIFYSQDENGTPIHITRKIKQDNSTVFTIMYLRGETHYMTQLKENYKKGIYLGNESLSLEEVEYQPVDNDNKSSSKQSNPHKEEKSNSNNI